ncbi:MAG: hypothetical protein QOD12_3212 [Verrucomicrobiota bacterium]|jgi:hypothetical protein
MAIWIMNQKIGSVFESLRPSGRFSAPQILPASTSEEGVAILPSVVSENLANAPRRSEAALLALTIKPIHSP